jgi:hypothetical protein
MTATDSMGHAVTFSGSIGGSSFSCGAPCTQGIPEGSGAYAWTATCTGGQTAGGNGTYQVDSTPPVVNYSLSGGTSGAGGWYTAGPVTLICTGSDGLSGFAGITYGAQVASGEGSHTLSCTGADNAGNTATQSVIVNIDSMPPAITPTVSGGTPGGSGWYLNGPVTLTCNATDATSGGVVITYGTQVATAPGTTTLDCTATDAAGNSSYYSTPIIIDNGLPDASFQYNGSYCTGGWYNSPVYISLLVSDLLSGPGMGSFRVDGDEWNSGRPVMDGIHSITGVAFDSAGNRRDISDTLQVDTYPPMSSFFTESGSWFAGSVTLEGQSVDWTSGIRNVEISLDNGQTWFSVGGRVNWTYEWDTLDPDAPVPDGSYTILARALDNACNQEHTGVVQINVDNTPPDLSLDSAIVVLGNTTSFDTADAGSGMDKVRVTISGNGIAPRVMEFSAGGGKQGLDWDGRDGNGAVAPFGLYEVLVEAWDKVGNYSATTGSWVRPEPKKQEPPVLPAANPPGENPAAPADERTNAGEESAPLPPMGLPFWSLVLPLGALGVWLTGSTVALARDRRWSELRGIARTIARYQDQTRINFPADGDDG